MDKKIEVYTFKSGYQVWIKPEYNPHLRDLAVERWREDHLPPEPPTKLRVVPVKDGVKEITVRDTNDPAYQALYSVWLTDLQGYQEDMTLLLAVDRTKLDLEVIEMARAWSKDSGVDLPSDDTQLFIHSVASSVKYDLRGRPDGKGSSELDEFMTWLNGLGGPSELLIEQFRKFNLQNGSAGTREDDGHLAMSNPRSPKSGRNAKSESPSVQMANLQTSGE